MVACCLMHILNEGGTSTDGIAACLPYPYRRSSLQKQKQTPTCGIVIIVIVKFLRKI
jgi:hypothetical protein